MDAVLVVVAAFIALALLAGVAIAKADDARPIRRTGDMTRADEEARARSAGDHMTPPSGN